MLQEKNSARSSALWFVSVRHWRPLTFVLIMTSVLCLASCKTAKSATASASSSSDSLALRLIQGVRVSSQTAPVSMDAASVTLPLRDLTQLPDGASYTGRQGTARVTATRKGDNLLLEGESLNTGTSSLTLETTQQGGSTGLSHSQGQATHSQGGSQTEQTRRPRDTLAAVFIFAGVIIPLLWLWLYKRR